MRQLTELIEVENKLNGWEITDPAVARYIMKDKTIKENWLRKGKEVQEYVLSSNLGSDYKTVVLNRINKSYDYFKTDSDELLKRIVDFGLGFVLGAVTLFLVSKGMNKIEGNFFESMMGRFYERMNLNRGDENNYCGKKENNGNDEKVWA